MKNIIAVMLLLAPAFAGAQEKTTSASAKQPAVQAAPEKKTNVYQTIADELLKNCDGVDKKIAVAGFSYSDGRDSRDGGVVAERITTELVKVKKFKVIERKEIEKVFEELKFQHSGAISPESAKEIGKMLGADWVVVGTLIELPDKRLEINTRLVAVESAEIITAASTRLIKDWLDQYRKLLDEQNRAIEKNSKDAKAFYEKGKVYVDLGEYENAKGSFGVAITIDPIWSDVYLGRGDAYYYNGEYDKAIEDYSKAIVIGSNSSEVYSSRGMAYAKSGENIKAIEDCSKAIAIDPKSTQAYLVCGVAYNNRGDHDKAIESYSKVVTIDPNDANVYLARGVAYADKGEHDKAIEDCSKAITITPKYVEAYFIRGNVYSDKGEYNKAIEDYSKVIAIDPKVGEVYSVRGFYYSQKGEWSKAIEDYSTAISIDPKNVKAYSLRGMAYRAKGEYKKAVADEKKYQSLLE